MFEWVRRSVQRKLMFVVLATTFAALVVSAIALVIYDLRTYQRLVVNDLLTQADILGRASAPAVAFNDQRAARENLALLRHKGSIVAAAVYTPSGALFAHYTRGGDPRVVPPVPEAEGYRVSHDYLDLFKSIVENDEVAATVYLRSEYEPLARLADYVTILGSIMLASLAIAFLMSAWLQGAMTRPLFEIAQVARAVMGRRDFSLRVRKTTDDEVGEMVDAFNDMLAEIGRRASALEQTNRSLEHEMAERRTAEEALRAADRLKDEFLATLAHELRNPLAPIRNSLELLRLRGADSDIADRARNIIERQVKQMVHLVDDLLDVSRITTGKIALHRAPVPLNDVLRSAVETVRPFLESHRHKLEVSLPDQPVTIYGDPVRLAQIFSNLLNNAGKYTPDGGRITVRAQPEGRRVSVEVSDTGIGIPAEMLPRIFEMFVQVDRSLERTHAGLGVGLTLARRLTELHEGTLEANSDGPGSGSRFVVRLPIMAREEASRDDSGPDDGAASSQKRRVLVADDNLDFVDSVALLLENMGNEVRVAHDGEEALEAASEFSPEVVFLDIGMPKVNGYEVARRLRSLPATAAALIVAVTGWGQEHDRRLAREAGFDHHLVKPVSPEDIARLMREAPA